jgi:diguanylate cyclase (GGDEF)-like protein
MSGARGQTFRGRESLADSKAGLCKAELLAEELENALASAKRRGSTLSVAVVELDQADAINDHHGRSTADEAIEAAAKVVLDLAADHEGIVARFAGDQICVLLPAEPLESARRIAEEARERIDRLRLPLGYSGEVLAITVSIGVASYPEHGPTSEGLLAAADVAVYDAKLEGRNRTRIASPPRVREALKLESAELRSRSGLSTVPSEVDGPVPSGTSLDDGAEPLDEPVSAPRSRLVVSYAGALCIGALSAGAVLVGALSTDAAIPNLLWLAVILAGGLPLLTLWIAEKQHLGRWRPIVTDLRISNDELETANSRLFGLLDENRQLLGRMQRSYLSTITSLARTAEAKDPHTSGHTERVAEIALLIAGQLGVDESELPAIRVGAIIHDIGKVGTPDQAGSSHARGNPGDPKAPRDRNPHHRRSRAAHHGQADGPQPSRAIRRRRVPRRADRRADPACRAHPLRGRGTRRDDQRPALPRCDAAGRGLRRDPGQGRDAVLPARRGGADEVPGGESQLLGGLQRTRRRPGIREPPTPLTTP